MKNKKAVGTILMLLIVMAILGGGYLVYRFGIQQAALSQGRPLEPMTFTGNEASFYTCGENGEHECVVYGSMVINNSYAAEGDAIVTCNGQSDGWSTINECEADGAFRGSISCSAQNCKITGTQSYIEVDFDFCPGSSAGLDRNYAYCDGASSVVTTIGAKVTQGRLLKKGETISFNPKNIADPSKPITQKTLIVERYDLTCINNLNTDLGGTCDPNNEGLVYCNPTQGEFTYVREFVNNCRDTRNQQWVEEYGNDVCPDGSDPIQRLGIECASYASKAWCDSTSYNKFNSCSGDTNIEIGGNSCIGFDTTTSQCAGNQVCVVEETGQIGEGIGRCQCIDQGCALGEQEGQVGASSYQLCVQAGNNCNQFTTVSCPAGSEYRPELEKCWFNPNDVCNDPNQARCATGGIEKCTYTQLNSDIKGYTWKDPVSCGDGRACQNDAGDYDSCTCEAATGKEEGDIECIGRFSYTLYQTTSNSCSTTINLDEAGTIECKNNELVERQDVGCSFNEVGGYECSTLKNSEGILLEQCVTNTCIENPNSGVIATEEEFLALATKCGTNNDILKIKKYGTGDDLHYRYESSESCGTDYICTETLSTIPEAKCIPGFEDVGIISKDSYGVGEPINNVTVIVTSEVLDKSNVQVIGQIYRGTQPFGTRITTVTKQDGTALLNFGSTPTLTGEYKIQVIVGDPEGLNFETNKTIIVAKKLNLLLSCPAQGFVNTNIKCTWITEDTAVPGTPISSTPKITVIQDGELDYTPVGTTGLTFKTDTLGGVQVEVEVSKSGYISTKEITSISIQETQIQPTLLIDNQDYTTVGTSLETGTHQIKLSILDSARNVADIQNIVATIEEPSGRSVDVTFVKSGDAWVTSYNLQQAGSNYKLKGEIIPTDITEENIPFSYPLITLGQGTESDTTINRGIYIVLATFGFVLILALVIFFLVRRGKRKR